MKQATVLSTDWLSLGSKSLEPEPPASPEMFDLQNLDTKNQFNAHLKGVGVPNLHLKEIRNTEILNPPIFLQNQFAKRIEGIEKQKARINQSISETQL